MQANFNQSVSFIDIPAGFRIWIHLRDFGQVGEVSVYALFDINGRKVPTFNSYNLADFSGTNDTVYIDMDDCKLISLGITCSSSCSAHHAKHAIVYLAKWQGRGAMTPVGTLISQDISPSNPISFPVPTQKQHPTIYGTPAVIDGVVDFKIIEFTIPNNWLFHITSVTFKLVTDATVVNRVPYLDITQDGVITGTFAGGGSVLASSAWTFTYGRNGVISVATLNNLLQSYIPDQFLVAGDVVTVRTPTMVVGDEYQDFYMAGEYIHTGLL